LWYLFLHINFHGFLRIFFIDLNISMKLKLFLAWKHSQRSHPSEWTFLKTTFLYVWKINTNHNFFSCSKHSNLESGQSLFFSNVIFFYQMCTINFWKLKRILTLMIKTAKGLELMKIVL
jgi:hypothetical protein